MSWIHINKFGVNALIDSADVKYVGFAKGSNGACVLVVYKDRTELVIESGELNGLEAKCHQLVREIAETLKAMKVGVPVIPQAKDPFATNNK
jgi:hypothetical protein